MSVRQTLAKFGEVYLICRNKGTISTVDVWSSGEWRSERGGFKSDLGLTFDSPKDVERYLNRYYDKYQAYHNSTDRDLVHAPEGWDQ